MRKYYSDLNTAPVSKDPENGFLKKLMPKMFSAAPKSFEELLEEFSAACLPYTTHWQSPHFYAFFPANAIPSTVLGEMCMVGLNEINLINSEPSDWKNSKHEQKVLDWIADMLQLPK